jgi:hypothetical protein
VKLVHVTFHFEYAEVIEAMLDRHGIRDFVRYPLVEGADREGKHFGTQVFPGQVTVVQAQVPEDRLGGLLDDLRRFRDARKAHAHLEALVLPIERTL